MESKVIEELTVGRCKNNTLIEGETFEGNVFESFSINPADGVEVKFKNCTFNKCRISRGSFQLGKNVVLEDVVFDNIEVSGDLDIHSGVQMTRSKFVGSNTTDMLWIKNIMSDPGCDTNVIELDISEFNGEIIITGNDVSQVTTNTENHIFVYAELLNQDRFKLNRANFFRSSASKVKNNGGRAGVFSIPKDKLASEEFREQLEYFETKGYVTRKYDG
jgi:hypothetical protein